MDSVPAYALERSGSRATAVLTGDWTSAAAEAVEAAGTRLLVEAKGLAELVLDLTRVRRLDTLGAWVLDRARHELGVSGTRAEFGGLSEAQGILLHEVAYRTFETAAAKRPALLVTLLSDIGKTVVGAGGDVVGGVGFLGAVMAGLGRVLLFRARFRFTSLVFHLEQIGLRSVPIIALISFLVGCIVAQQGIFQLNKFGATAFVVDLTGILTLRELGLLLTAIMVAGRSGSAFTAEIGSMKMREEIDALRVMGLDPIDVLVVPRVLALIIAMPLLTFIADMAALFGGGVVAWLYGSISQDVFLSRLQSAIGFNTFMVGIIKAPFMALVIGLIASIEGLAVQGSAESLGRQVTSSVVKSIFMVIVVDGLFAMFFAAIKY
jgi:phospholipid/cholesterol/gamma-HCH transport system permease protein